MCDHVHPHTIYVSMGNVRKPSFLYDVSMAKLIVLDRILKIVTVRHAYTHMMYVGMGNVRTSLFLCNS